MHTREHSCMLHRKWPKSFDSVQDSVGYQWPYRQNLTLINIKGTAYAEGNHASPAFTINVFQSLSTNVDALRLREDNVEVVSGMFLLTLNPRTKIPPVPSDWSISEMLTVLNATLLHLHQTHDLLWHYLLKPSITSHFIMPKLLSIHNLVSLFILLNVFSFFLVDESYLFIYQPYCIYLFILAVPYSM